MAGKMEFIIDVESRQAQKNVDNLQKGFDNLDKTAEKTSKRGLDISAKKLIGLGAAAFGAKKALDFIGSSISAASEAMETNSKLNTIFADRLDMTSAAVKDLNDNWGFSVTQAERMLATTGDLLSGFGFAGDAAFDMSVQVQKLAADTASFSNIEGGAARASEALTALILGQTEKAKALGIVVNQGSKEFKDQVKAMQEAKDMTLVQAKAVVLLEEATRQSHNAIGDFAKTQGSFANQSKQLANTLEDLKIEFGKVFVEVALPLLTDFSDWVKDNKDLIVSAFHTIGKAVNFLTGAFQALGLASQILDNIDKIAESQKSAAESMQEYANKLLDFRFQAEFLGKDMSKLDEAIDLFQASTGDANEKFAELNAIWADIKAGEFGQHVADQFKVFNAEYIKNISLQKDGTKTTKENTDAVNANSDAKDGNKKALEDTNIIIPDTIQLNEDLNDSLQDVLNSMEDAKRQQDELAAGFEFEYNEAVKNAAQETAGAADELTRWEKIALAVNKIDMASYFGAMSKALDMLGDAFGITNEAFNNFKGMASSLASGDWLGAIVSGIGFIGDLFGKDGLSGHVEWATEALRELGVTGEETIQLLSDNLEELYGDMTIGEAMEAFGENWEQTLADMEQMAEDAAKSSREWFEPMKDAIGPLNDFLAQGAQGQMEFNDQVNITLGTFANLMKSGLSITETLGMMGDSFDQLIATQQEGQFEGSKLFNELAKFRTLIKDNEALVKSVEGFNTLLGATAELGEISQEQLSSFAREAGREFEKLTEAGFSQNQALQMLGPSLLTLEQNASEYGHTIDANTQKLIDQAREAGVFDEMADPMDKLLDVMVKIGEVLGADMSDFNAMGASAAAGAGQASDSFDKASLSIKGVGDAAKTAGTDTVDSFEEAEASIMKTGEASEMAAQTMTNAFNESTAKTKEAFSSLAAHAAKTFDTFGDLKGLNIPGNGQPLNQGRPPRNMGFAIGTPADGFRVPNGFPNDTYNIGATTGERVFVDRGGNGTINNRTSNFVVNNNIAATINADQEQFDRMLVSALEKNGIVQRSVQKLNGGS
jgi:hypothetical protein